MHHTKFRRNRPLVPGKMIFKMFTIYGHDMYSHLGHVTSIMLMNFHFLVPNSLSLFHISLAAAMHLSATTHFLVSYGSLTVL